MQPLSLTPKEHWAVSKEKPDNMVLAATSWPGKTLCCWKMFLLSSFTSGYDPGEKRMEFFCWPKPGCQDTEQKCEKWRPERRWSPVSYQVTPWLVYFSNSRLQDLWILPDFQVHAQWFYILDPSQQLSGFALQFPVTIHGMSHSSVPQLVSHVRGLSLWQTDLAVDAWTWLQCCCSKQDAKANPYCARNNVSTTAATTANLLSCTWYSDLSLAVGGHSSKVRFATSQQH